MTIGPEPREIEYMFLKPEGVRTVTVPTSRLLLLTTAVASRGKLAASGWQLAVVSLHCSAHQEPSTGETLTVGLWCSGAATSPTRLYGPA